MVRGTTPAHKGLAPSRLIPIFIGKDAHAGHTQCIKKIGHLWLNRKVCEYLQSPLNIKFGVYSRKDKSKIFIFS